MSKALDLEAAFASGLEGLVQALIDHQASDLHLTPEHDHYSVRLRSNGHIHMAQSLRMEQGRSLVQTFKAAGKMNIAESRRPQDGRISLPQAELRLACHPSLHGENMVIRLLTRQHQWALASLGFCNAVHADIERMLQNNNGLVLVAGPTGSGKTTTLHAMLGALGSKAGRIATLEDPVEIVNPDALQTDLSRLPHLDFAGGLRSLMRQDPDTILVGEIRDKATAELTLHAALTGHRVLASIHAADCLGTLCRLVELNVSLPSLMNCLNGITAQRLLPSAPGQSRRLLAQSAWFGQIPKAQRATLTSLREIGACLPLKGDLDVD
ncbi:MAG TPA: ATPase, T2SS/T4P/T4SS family [Limnobacter sp.]|nr:ATPase, T2SS/T4P/T4SS family [Limnobacter sp.]